jgi:hypothetical protein
VGDSEIKLILENSNHLLSKAQGLTGHGSEYLHSGRVRQEDSEFQDCLGNT